MSSGRGWLAHIDASSGAIVSMISAPGDATGEIVVGPHSTWVAESSLGVGVVRVHSRHLRLLSISAGALNVVAVDKLAVGGGLVWAYGVIAAGGGPGGGGTLTSAARVVSLDERTGRITHILRFPAGPYGIAYGNGALFAADFKSGRLFRVGPNYRVHFLRRVRGPGTLVAVTPGAVWATTRSGTLRRITVPAG